jgi:glutaredoxin-like protein NrdH
VTDHPPITVYTAPGCRSCKRVIDTLEASGLDLEVVDLSDPAFADARTYVTEVLGAKSVPVVVSEAYDVIIGYQPDMLNRLIETYRYVRGLTSNGEK